MSDLILPIISLDIGQKKTGLAITESGIVIRPLKTLHHHNQPNNIAESIRSVLQENECHHVVCGIPLNTEGQPSAQSNFVEEVVYALQGLEPTLIVNQQDERGTTLDANVLYQDVDDDCGAAILILQDWLDNFSASRE